MRYRGLEHLGIRQREDGEERGGGVGQRGGLKSHVGVERGGGGCWGEEDED